MKTKVCFKAVKYGDFKNEVIAVINPINSNGNFETFVLLEGHSNADSEYIRTSTRNAKPKEYQATLTVMTGVLGYDIEIVKSLNYKIHS